MNCTPLQHFGQQGMVLAYVELEKGDTLLAETRWKWQRDLDAQKVRGFIPMGSIRHPSQRRWHAISLQVPFQG